VTNAPRIARAIPRPRDARGATLLELMIALVVLGIGVLALVRLFPAGVRQQSVHFSMTTADHFAHDKLEQLRAGSWFDGDLSVGRHPTGSATEALGSAGQWRRFYTVDILPSPLDNLKRITVTVTWNGQANRSVSTTTYVKR